METVAVNETCATPNNGSPIGNCCDLKKPPEIQLAFSEIVVPINKPIYKV